MHYIITSSVNNAGFAVTHDTGPHGAALNVRLTGAQPKTSTLASTLRDDNSESTTLKSL